MTQPPVRSRRQELALAVILTLLANLAFFHYLLRQMPYFQDIFNEFYSMKVFLAGHLRQGRIPLWNPTQVMGMPFAADPATACFYPLNFLFLLLSPLQGLRYYLLLHYPLAGLGMYWLLRDLRLRPAAAAIGAMTFSWSGYLVAMHWNIIYLISAAYFPWAFFCFRRMVLRNSWPWTIGAGLAVGLPFLAGEPQGAALAALIGIASALLAAGGGSPRESRGSPAPSPRKLVSLLLAALLFIAGLVMIQFLPSWELGRYSERAQGFSLDRATCFSFYPLRFLEFLWPNLWGLPWPEDHFWGGFMTDWCFHRPFVLGVYLGLWPLLAAALALRRRVFAGKPETLFFAGLALLALLLAAGRYTPFFTVAYHLVPGLRLFRFPEKYLALFSLGIAALAGIGTHQFLESPPAGPRLRRAARIGLRVMTLAAILGWILQQPLESGVARLIQHSPAAEVGPAAATEALLGALTRSGIVALVLALALEIARANSRRIKALPAFLIALTALDLFSANRPLVPTAPAEAYTQPAQAFQRIRRLQADPNEKFRVYRDDSLTFVTPGAPTQLRSHLWQKDTLGPNWARAYGLEDFGGYTPAQLNQIEPLWEQGMTHDLLRSFNIKYLLVPLDWSQFDAEPGVQTLEADPDNNLRILLYGGYFPRAYLVPRARAVATEKEALSRLLTLDFKHEVILITSEVLPRASENGGLVPAEVKQYDSDRVVLEVRSEHPGWLVLTDSYFPGWEARVNGRPAQIYRANYLARAVRVEAGQSEIVFVYRPKSYLWGRAITLATLGLAMIGILVGVVLRKMAPPPNWLKP